VPHERPLDGWAEHEPRAIPTPAVATGFTYVVPGTVRERIMAVSFVLVADANAANRLPRVEYLNAAGDVFASVAAPFVLTATLTSRFTFAVGLQQFGANAAAQIGGPLPPLKLNSGLSVRVSVGAVQAGDQISVASLFVDQWPVRDG
jgi:hypothetical protein